MISQVSVLHGLHWVFFFWAKETKRVKQTKQFFTTKPTNFPGGRLEQEYCCSYTATDGHCRYCACNMSCLWFLLFVTCSWLTQSTWLKQSTCNMFMILVICNLFMSYTITAAMTTRVTTPAPPLPATTSPGTPRYCAQNTFAHQI